MSAKPVSSRFPNGFRTNEHGRTFPCESTSQNLRFCMQKSEISPEQVRPSTATLNPTLCSLLASAITSAERGAPRMPLAVRSRNSAPKPLDVCAINGQLFHVAPERQEVDAAGDAMHLQMGQCPLEDSLVPVIGHVDLVEEA